MIGVREKKKQKTRKAIVDAAVKLFAENGFEETSMEELAREAGVGKSTIYGYFKTKEEIFLGYCEAELDFAFAALDRKIDEDAPLAEQLVAQMMGQITFVTQNREFGRVFIREMLFPSESTRIRTRELDNRYVGKLAEVLERAQKRGELPQESNLLLLIGHFHALYILTLSTIYSGEVVTVDNAEFFLHALVLQALNGPASLSSAPQNVQDGLIAIRQKFIEQHNFEMGGQS